MEATKTSSKRIVAILLLALGLIALVLGVLGLLGGGAMQPYDARNSVVLVAATVADDQGNTSMGWGTGWAIGKPGKPVEYIVTNGHVVEQAYTYPQLYTNVQGQLQVVFNAAENDFVIPEVVYYSAPQEKDIAILRLPTPTEKRIPLQLRPSETVDIGEAAWALGYPGISSMYQQYSTFSPDDITLTQGIISKRNKPTGSSYEAFQMDVYINSGNSGGPLVDKNGFLLGINSAGIQSAEGTSEGVNYAIIANELIRILDNERLEYAVANTGLAWAPRWMGYVFLPLGALAEGAVPETPYSGDGFDDEMLLIVNCPGPLLDLFLQAFRRQKLAPVRLKAVLTPTNREWDSVALHAELCRERQAIAEGQAAHRKGQAGE